MLAHLVDTHEVVGRYLNACHFEDAEGDERELYDIIAFHAQHASYRHALAARRGEREIHPCCGESLVLPVGVDGLYNVLQRSLSGFFVAGGVDCLLLGATGCQKENYEEESPPAPFREKKAPPPFTGNAFNYQYFTLADYNYDTLVDKKDLDALVNEVLNGTLPINHDVDGDKNFDIYDLTCINLAINGNKDLKTTYKVTFIDLEGNVISTQFVNKGENAKEVSFDEVDGYTLCGYSKSLNKIYQDTVIYAKYILK